MIVYNYITTNLITGKQYIGMHSTINVDDGYLGSGQLMLKAFKKYGKQNFKREILCICQTLQEANQNEKLFIEKYNTLNPCGYNLSPTGGLGFKGCHSDEARAKMIGNKNAVGNIQTVEMREKNRQSKIGNTWGFQNGHKIRRIQSEEERKKRSEIMKGNKRGLGHKHTEEELSKMRLNHRGHPHSEETRKKMSEAQIRRHAINSIE
jgi:hypothetical protein